MTHAATRFYAEEGVRREYLGGRYATGRSEANADSQTAERGEPDREELAATDST